ncbi:sensor domain-containing protein [Phytohabitans sp. ZYX-F-186]|uniref:histidine kinase n=1 Tax=Phytohabitans maris TaxID=3071409 RepID=A0ABU0Z999_9ACTN|nr:sensor domain-containing protein [Phytohabitans sp. ZYX-F-186]MDQ7903613.1 sensor domain-containing protein [Phytohabitans sp. ZYX-F-186]
MSVNRVVATERLGQPPWSPRAWQVTAHVLVGGVVGLVTGGVVLALALATALLAVTVVFALGTGLALFACVHAFAALQRSRFEAFLGEEIPAPPPHPYGGWARRLAGEARSETLWRQFGYHVFALVVGGAGAGVVALAWAGGLLLLTAPLHSWLLADDPAGPVPLVLATAAGVGLLFAAPWLARGVAAVDLLAARALLGPSPRAELAQRVALLSRSRAELVEAADAERRRIERDLHDGMQQRLVSLAMNLGLARASFPDAPDPLRDALARSHDDAKLALSELRDVVRGLYPAVLDNLGLDAALSGVAARSPVPARLRVDLPRRPPVAIEAVAYFVVSEALANVAKHSGATSVEVAVHLLESGDRLRVVIADDGRGGARPERGTGLRGLAQRVSSVDGTLDIDSPDGGPTTITVELPCAS